MRYAVILAGGSGHRLWPASRKAKPKQFLALGARTGESLLAATRRRIGALCPAERIVVVTAASQVAQVRNVIDDLAQDAIVAEPLGRNTAAAMGLAALHLLDRDPQAVMAALPADHHIANEAEFAEVAGQAFELATERDDIVTIGVVPSRAETGFGYLHVGQELGPRVHTVKRFVEKPDPETAQTYFASGDYLWNSGLYFMTAARLLREIEIHLPKTRAGLSEIQRALAAGGPDTAMEATKRVYPVLPSISIDHGVMERTREVITIRADFGWNDVGSWAALADYRKADAAGNIIQGQTVLHDAQENIVICDPDCAVAVIGVKDLVVVQSGNAILVVPRERAQDVRAAVAGLKQQKLDQYL